MDNVPNLSTICQCLKLLELQDFRSLLGDHWAKKLFTGNTIQLHVAGQLLGATSYDMITEQLQAHVPLQEITGLSSISRSTLSRKTTTLCTDTLQAVFVKLVQAIQHLHPDRPDKLPGGKKLRLLDATELTLPLQRASWANCSKSKHGVKMHTRVVVADPAKLVYPDRIIASTVDVNETELSLELVTDPEAIHIMDRGYQKHEHFERWDQPANKINFVSRIRENTQFVVTRDFRIPKADRSFIVSDRKVLLNKCSRKLRLIVFRDEEEKDYFLITNCFEVSAAEIAQMYKYRWLIELFFKWIKQHLRMVKVFSYSPQGIWNQLYLVLIAFALCTLVRLQTATSKTAWEVLKLIRIYAHYPWAALLQALERKPSRTSKGRQRLPAPREPQPVQKKVIVR
ncbi:IS4 family transposase [Paenibacillus macerans]|uniref:IS4 family transposase n=2 Tax=Paenibacillus macerans TaxID=44252 RepID=A0A6N8EQK3_PAEMA|nr:IS4 family transposase [Paenibacillus macerans]MUG21814.1 IS4 family transposase [Paenibacillus macerans]